MPRIAAFLVLALFLSQAARVSLADDEWDVYSSKEYGFTMNVPRGTKFVEKEKSGGWATLYAKQDDLEFFAITKQGEQASAEEIEKFGVKATGIAGKLWKVIDQGSDNNGWKWWKTVEAREGKTLVFAGYGVGPKGSYLCFIKTTVEDYEDSKDDYKAWYKSIKLH